MLSVPSFFDGLSNWTLRQVTHPPPLTLSAAHIQSKKKAEAIKEKSTFKHHD